jgi:hypothetical protein
MRGNLNAGKSEARIRPGILLPLKCIVIAKLLLAEATIPDLLLSSRMGYEFS